MTFRPTRRYVLRAACAAALAVVTVALGRLIFPSVYLLGAAFLWDRAEPEVHLIPAGYQGPVLVIYDDSTGAMARYEGEARRYDIPRTGVLRTRFAPNHGWGRPSYFYVDSLGRRTAIVRGTTCDDSLPGDPVEACFMPREERGYAANPSYRSPIYDGYVVSRRANRQAIYQRGDSLVNVAVFGQSR